jgi:hypothetical protein
MLARSRFAVPLDRSEVRCSPAGSLDHADSQFPVIICKNEFRPTCGGNPDAKQRSAVISTGSFLMGSALSANEQPRREQQ